MKKITLSDTTATVEDCGIVQWLSGSVVNPFVGQPLTSQQAWIFGSACLVGGVALGTAFAPKIKKYTPRIGDAKLQRDGEKRPTEINSVAY